MGKRRWNNRGRTEGKLDEGKEEKGVYITGNIFEFSFNHNYSLEIQCLLSFSLFLSLPLSLSLSLSLFLSSLIILYFGILNSQSDVI